MAFILLGIGFLIWVLAQLLRYRRLREWQEVEGFITDYDIEKFKQSQVYVMVDMIRPVVKYVYEIGGQKYTGSKISLEDHSLKVNLESKSYPWPNLADNMPCVVYVNPNSPKNSVLIRKLLPSRVTHYTTLAVIGVLLILIGVGINYVQP